MLARRIAALSFALVVSFATRPAAAQSSLAQRMATIHGVMATPRITAPRHTATELLTKYRSTAAGASAIAAAHKIALSGTAAGAAAAGKTAGGTGSGVAQSSQPGGSSASSGTSNTSSAALDITIDPAQSLSGSATAGATTMQAALYFFGTSGGSVFVGQTLAGPSYLINAAGGALLSTNTLSPGWYLVTFDLYDWTHTEAGTLSQMAWGSSPTQAADCNTSVLAQTDSRGVSTCMALVQVTQSASYNFVFALNSGSASVIDAAISRVNP